MAFQGPPSYSEAMKAPSAPPMEHHLMSTATNSNNPALYNTPQIYPSIQQPQPVQQPYMNPVNMSQPAYQQPLMQQPQTVIVVNQVVQYGENPVSLTCPHCRKSIVSKTNYENNVINHLLAGILCFMGLWCGCCCIPYCIDSIKDVTHKCPSCGNFLGIYRRGRRF